MMQSTEMELDLQKGIEQKSKNIINEAPKRKRGESSDEDTPTTDSDDESDLDSSSDDSTDDGSTSDDERRTNAPHVNPLQPSKGVKQSTPMIFVLKTQQNILVPPPQTPYEAFRWFLPDDLLDTIVSATNDFVARLLNATNDLDKKQFSSWTELTRNELLIFLGLLLHTGTIKMDNLSDYWKKNNLVNLKVFSMFMSQERFFDLLKSLKFSLEETTSSSHDDSLAGFRFIVHNFNKTMKRIYYPGKQLTVANLRTKTGTRNVDSIVLADSNGIILRYQVHTDTDAVSKDQHILDLLEGFDQGHILYVEKYFSSHKLAAELLNHKTYCTLQLNRSDKDKLLPGTSQIKIRFKNRSIKSKYYLTTEYGREILITSECKEKFMTIMNYNNFMMTDKLKNALSDLPRTNSGTSGSLLIQALQIYLNNAYLLLKLYNKNYHMSSFAFRVSVLKCLLPVTEMASTNAK